MSPDLSRSRTPARPRGFSRAARTVHVSQPTVSKGVQSVEEALAYVWWSVCFRGYA